MREKVDRSVVVMSGGVIEGVGRHFHHPSPTTLYPAALCLVERFTGLFSLLPMAL